MSPSSVTSIPKAPAERTFVVAVTLLSAAAVLQLIAVALALAPQIDLEKIGRSMASRPAPAATTPQAASSNAPGIQQADALVLQAQKLLSQNDFQGALPALIQAVRLAPNRPGALYLLASNYHALNQEAEAIAVLKEIVALPPNPNPADEEARGKARAALEALGASAPAPAAQTSNTASTATGGDEVGIPIGSVMGIVTAELLDGDPGQKNLRVSTKAANGQKIDSQKFVATVDFYAQDDRGQVQHDDSPQVTEWLSLPATWSDGVPEIFQTKYRLPLKDRGDLPALQFYGYVVAIYYNGELQDSRAQPVTLLDQFAPPLHKSSVGE